jgi:putative spermidine/putrescine transport system permease protein
MSIERHWGRALIFCIANATLGFLLLPVFAVVPASLSAQRFVTLPPSAYSLAWYVEFFTDTQWLSSMLTSFLVACVAVAICGILAVPAALGLRHIEGKARIAIGVLLMSPILLPTIICGVAIYRTAFSLELDGTLAGLVLSHAVLALPIMLANVTVAMAAIQPDWLRAAQSLGAGSWHAFRTIILPLSAPGIAGGATFAFVTSFDEFTVSTFMASDTLKTLPIKIWESVRLDFSPEAAAASTLVIVIAITVSAARTAFSLTGRRRR